MTNDGELEDDNAVGYGKAPVSNRFPKGKSGNPRGRPVGRRNKPPYEAVLGQMATIREDGTERRVNAAEAFLLHVTKQGLEGDGAAARAAMAAIAEARATPPRAGRRGHADVCDSLRDARKRQLSSRTAPHGEKAGPVSRHGPDGSGALDC